MVDRRSNPITGLVPPCVEDRRFKSSYWFGASLCGGQEVQIQLLVWCLPVWWTGGSNPVTVLMPPCVVDRRFKSSYCFSASLCGGPEVQIQLLF